MARLNLPTVWVPNSPNSLFDLAVEYCVNNPKTFCNYNPDFGYKLRDGIALSHEICERMLELCKKTLDEEEFFKFVRIFADSNTRLRCLDLRDSSVRDTELAIFSYHTINELNISGCTALSCSALKCIARISGSLQSLIIGSNSNLFCNNSISSFEIYDDPVKENFHFDAKKEKLGNYLLGSSKAKKERIDGRLSQEDFFKQCIRVWPINYAKKEDELRNELTEGLPKLTELPMLRKLVIHELVKTAPSTVFMKIVKTTSQLIHLDLSHSKVWGFDAFVHHPLLSLILYDVYNVQECLPVIYQMKTIRHLDLSSTEAHAIVYEKPNYTLKCIVDNLVNLSWLDISGTNLAGTGTLERTSDVLGNYEEKSPTLTDIPGLASRVDRPLEFLGLLNCSHQACYRHHIPAVQIAGDNGEEQILTSGQVYCSREAAIQKVLNDLFSLFRFSECRNIPLALDIIMEAMRLHLKKKSIQVAGSASLFYIVKSDRKDSFNVKIRRKIIKTLIDAMFAHYSDTTMLRNGCLAIIHFKIPEDMFFDYERFASLLLLIVSQEEQDEFVQRIGVYLLNSLACQVDGIEKKLVGDRGAITIMLQIIEKRLERSLCDEVMETAWSTMWNITDETPVNCARFLEGSGMDLFLRCLEAFPSKPELLRNMIGLLGNVAEVKELRRCLMKEEYLIVFSDLLDSRCDGIEVSYNAAGILSHIASDGPELWTTHNIVNVKRTEVLQKMVQAIDSWDLNTKRNINYRSFKPILRLLSVYHTPEAQLWAVWALTNLTKVYPEKYCLLLQKEGGIPLLESLVPERSSNNSKPNSQMSKLALMAIENCTMYENHQESMSDSDDIDIM